MIDSILGPLYKWIILGLLIFIGCYVVYCNSLAKDLRLADANCQVKIKEAVAPYIAGQKKLLKKIAEADEALVREQKNIKIEFRDIKHETQKFIERNIFRECKLDIDSLQLAQRANEIANSSRHVSTVR